MEMVRKKVMTVQILIIDDLSFMRLAIRDILETAGFSVTGEAENGLEGYEQYISLKPDIVLMDITMPVMNGIQSLQKIKRADPAAKVIMCSAMGQQKYIIRSIQLGAHDFIVKPFRGERIISAVKKAMLIHD